MFRMKCHLCGKRFDWRDKLYGRTKLLDRLCKRCLRTEEEKKLRGRLREIKPNFTHFGAERTKAMARRPRMKPARVNDPTPVQPPLNLLRRRWAAQQTTRTLRHRVTGRAA